MKAVVILRHVGLGVAVGLLGFAGAACAQTASQDYQLVGVNARLERAVGSDSVKQGDAIAAKLDESVRTSDGVKLEKGTELEGTVANVAPSSNRGPASLTLVFTTAKLKDGKQIPVKVTLLAAYPSGDGDGVTYGNNAVAPPPQHIDPQQAILQEPGLLNKVELKSSVQGDDSGTFSKDDGNFRLSAGTYLQVGIASAGGSGAVASK
jgi:hypothetical protein